MKKQTFGKTAILTLVLVGSIFSQATAQQKVQKQTFDPWAWGKNTNSVQAVEVKNPAGHFTAPDRWQ